MWNGLLKYLLIYVDVFVFSAVILVIRVKRSIPVTDGKELSLTIDTVL
jgi:hypothetical protein